MSKDDIPKKIGNAVKNLAVQHGATMAPDATPQKHLPGVLNNMIMPSLLDTYIKPVRRLEPSNAAIIDFRRSYDANKSSNRAKEAVSYDGRPHVELHKRRLLLSAECQIGKTGAYLALLLELQRVLAPAAMAAGDISVLLPGTTYSDGPGEAEDLNPSPGTLLQVDPRYTPLYLDHGW